VCGAVPGREVKDSRPLDPVARFHLGNGARVERLNWGGDPSTKGMKQAFGLMVNYLYDLKRLDKHRALLAQGKLPCRPRWNLCARVNDDGVDACLS
jgi:malonyl-CoA decarboxylase